MAARQDLLLSVFVWQPTSSFLEWIAHHRTIGVNHIVVFIDRRQADKFPLLEALAASGVITLMPIAVDPDVKEEAHNSAIRAARLEAEESSGFGLYLTDDEYFCLTSQHADLQTLMQDCGKVDVLSAPVFLAQSNHDTPHSPGPILAETQVASHLPEVRSAVRMGLFASRSLQGPAGPANGRPKIRWANGDGELLSAPVSVTEQGSTDRLRGHGKALVLKAPAPTVETYLLRQQALPPRQHPSAEIQIDRLKTLYAAQNDTLNIDLGRDATIAELDKLLKLPKVAAAHEAICAAETSLCSKLRKTSKDFIQITAAMNAKAATSKPTGDYEDVLGDDPDVDNTKPPLTLPGWFSEIHTGGDRQGSYTRLEHHALVHIERDPTCLVVTFDNLSSVNDITPAREPWGYKIVRDNGFSHLSVMARRKDWYRDPQLISHLQNLSKSGLFDSYDRVIFSGTSMGGFAALAFASLAPGCTVISFSPQTTLDQNLVPWELRFGMGRARDWTLDHSDCANELAAVRRAFVLYDPFFEPDKRHVDRLSGANVTHLKTWCSGHFSPVFLRRAGLLKPVMQHVFDDTLTSEVFYQLFRARRTLPWYRKALISNLEERGHQQLARRVTPAFRKLRRQGGT